MFGKKAKKQAELEALERKKRALAAKQAAAQREEGKVFYESEIIADEDDDVVEIELVLDADTVKRVAAQQQAANEAPVQPSDDDVEELTLEEFEEEPEIVEEPEPEVEEEPVLEEEEPTVEEEPQAEETPDEPETVEEEKEEKEEETSTPEVRYVMDGPTEDDEIVKPARLVKLPNLIDYMLSLKVSKRMKMNVATLLLGAYAKFKDIPAEKEILISCMKKLMVALMNEK